MDNEKLFDFMTQMYAEMQKGFKDLNEKFTGLDEKLNKTNIIIESEIKPDIKALFDGYKQNAEQLTRIENEVKKHDEVILRRIK